MDNVSGNENISELFARKYCNLYNSVSLNDDELDVILNENICDVQVKCTDDIVNGSLYQIIIYILILFMLNLYPMIIIV